MDLKDYEITIENGLLCTPDHDLEVKNSIGELLLEACDKYKNRTFQICPFTGTSISFEEFKIHSKSLAANLHYLCGVLPGDIIMTCMKNSNQNPMPVAATFVLNAVTCSLDPSLSIRDCEYLINLVEPKIIFLDDDALPNIKAALKTCRANPTLIVHFEDSYVEQDEYLQLHDLLLPTENTENFKPEAKASPDDMATILFSSGTTGLPKGICLSQKSLLYTGSTVHGAMDYPTIFSICTTFYWISGIAAFIGQFLYGATKVPLRKFDIEEFCQVSTKYRVESVFLATNYASKFLHNKGLVNAMSSLKTVFAGGMTPTKKLFADLQTAFPKINFNQAYGMTEMGGLCCTFRANYRNWIKESPESTGLPIPGYTLKVIDPETSKVLGPNEQGEICCKSIFSMLGYYKNTTETPFDQDGFLRSGDLGYYDENKMIYITGRRKDMFKYLSWHIVPASLESVIQEHPAVDEVVVFGIAHDDDGFLPSAAVMLHREFVGHIGPDDIAKFVADRVADRQRLRGGVFIVDELPRTVTGKIQRNKVQEMFSSI